MLVVGGQMLGEIHPRDVKLASLFGGGMGGTRQEMCGVLSAGAMIMGVLYGRTRPGEDEQQARELAARFRERFLAEFGTTQCTLIRERWHIREVPGTCAPVAERAAEILLEVLDEEPANCRLPTDQKLPGEA